MSAERRMLVGFLIDGKHSGIDRYLLSLLPLAQEAGVTLDFLTQKADPELTDILSAYGSRLWEIPSLKNPVSQYKAIRKLIRTERYDDVYFNISEAFNGIGVLAARRERVSRIRIHSHASGVDRSNAAVRRFRTVLNGLSRRWLVRYGTDLYACSAKAGAWLYSEKTVAQGRVKILLNAIDFSRFFFSEEGRRSVRQEFSIPENAFVFGFVGNFCYAKHPDFLISVLKETLRRRPDSVLLMIGCGDMETELRDRAASDGLSGSIRFPGVRSDIPACMSAMDAFVLPSRFEGFSFVTLEAQANGLPCIVSDGIPQEAIVTDSVCALNTSDPAEWADRLSDFPARNRNTPEFHPGTMEKYDISSVKENRKHQLFDGTTERETGIYENGKKI